MDLLLLVDIGSTFTKVALVDTAQGELMGRACAPSTVATDVTEGLWSAVAEIRSMCGIGLQDVPILACSSAAGGLRMAVIGLVPDITVEVARLAALGAGARVVGSFSFEIGPAHIAELEELQPDIILFAGGTDGGNRAIVEANAYTLAGSSITCPIIVACNQDVADAVRITLMGNGRIVKVVPNILPAFDTVNLAPCREAIREIFLSHIIQANGIDRARRLTGSIIMPTPLAVMRGVELLSGGCAGHKGRGDLFVVDIGGATTDVYSAATGVPRHDVLGWHGIREPYFKRTVEGDAGVRINALTLIETCGIAAVLDSADLPITDETQQQGYAWGEYLSRNTGALPGDEFKDRFDRGLARCAVRVAARRHAGSVEPVWTPEGQGIVQHGKDLTGVKTVIGVGGVLTESSDPASILAEARFDQEHPDILLPEAPSFCVDRDYIMYAAGLLSEAYGDIGFQLIQQSLEKLE